MKFEIARTPSGKWLVFNEEFLEIEELGLSEPAARHLQEHLNRIQGALDYTKLYEAYPKQGGKATGLRWCKIHIRSTVKFNKIMDAIGNYCRHVNKNVRDEKFIKRFDFWLKEWENWEEDCELTPDPISQVTVPL